MMFTLSTMACKGLLIICVVSTKQKLETENKYTSGNGFYYNYDRIN